jgi:RNA polymerase sigma factor (sigma-70 family)
MAWARQLLSNPLDAEEAAQDAMLAVARQIHRFEGRSRFTTWLYQVCSNAAFDTHRRLRRRRSILGAEVSDHPSPERTSVVAGTRLDLLDALAEVDGRMDQPVVLRDVSGLDYATIAEVLGVPVGTVKSRLHEGRRLLTLRLRAE